MTENEYVIAEPFDPHKLIEPLVKPVIGLVAFFIFVFFGFDAFSSNFFRLFGSGRFPSNDFDPMSFAPILVIGVLMTFYTVAQDVREVLSEPILAVQSDGVTVADVDVPWSSIQQVVVIRPEPSAYGSGRVEVGLRLTDNAPLPEDLTSLVIDPESQTEIPSALRTSLVDGELDTDRLVAAVRSFAASSVTVVESQGTNEYELG